MSKTKPVQKIKPMQIEVNGTTYQCTRKNGKVTVRTARTAKGQNMIAGVYDIASNAWHNDNGSASLPPSVKDHIVRLMS